MKNLFIILLIVLFASVTFAGTKIVSTTGQTIVSGGAGGNTISYVATNGSTSANTTNGTTITINVPSGVSDGDMMYLAVLSDHTDSNDISTPSGWDVVGNYVTSSSSRMELFSRIASSEPASYDVTRGDGGAVGFAAVMACFEKTGGTWDPDQSTSTSDDTGAATLVSGAVTTTDGSFLIIAFGSDDETAVGSVSDMTNTAFVEQGSCSVGLWYESIESGSSITETWTPASSGDLSSIATVLEAE